ncbi:tRNA pseudouridine(13) synthase TruD [Methanocalculus taiwanensis]|uniref:Probable tRNA pseudouridine synthase D n=2 Tax=Methanocalculus taiwanensis TaxID=106207 RepID=A0ABD4TGP3_9EURY|nr:tRNA pseudouridine(13) synthase TruD [Methanocalculus taiwanensis]
MIPSPYPLEHELQMRYYGDDHPGIGGKLRTVPEDFVVEELPKPFTGSGPFLICRVTRRSWEHQHAIQEIAKRLGISRKRIGWAGTKDRNAVATHYISLYKVEADQVRALSFKDMAVEPVGQHQFGLSLGDLEGNRFGIRIRGCERENLASLQEIAETVKEGIPNYFGLQRFGAQKPVTHRVGAAILRGEYQEAVTIYIGDPFPNEDEEVKAARAAFRDTGDAAAALYALPVRLGFERAMLDFLSKHKGDYRGALKALAPKLLTMFVSGWQSYLFNAAISDRFDRGIPLDEPEAGDTLIYLNGRTDRATEKNLPTARQHIRRGRAMIAACMPGATPLPNPGPMEEHMIRLSSEAGITHEAFRNAAQYLESAFDGANRPIVLRTEIVAEIEDDAALLNFTLPPGHYATSVCRECMKGDPISLV